MKWNKKIGKYYLYDYIYLLSRIGLGIVFLAASYGKIPHITEFQKNVASYHILPSAIVPAFAFILPWVELLCGLYLILGLFQKYTAISVFFLLIIFIIAITYALLTNQPVSGCGCFSQTPTERIGWVDDIRDIFFLLLTIVVLKGKHTFLSIDRILFKKS